MADPQVGNEVVDLGQLIAYARQLEPLPAAALRLLDLCAQAETSVDDLVEVIEFDPALTGIVLRLANSAFSAPGRTIGNVHDAVVRLGVDLVLSSAIANGVGKHIRNSNVSHVDADLWRHSVAASMAANVIRRRSRHGVGREVSASGLLHDIGKIVLYRFINDDSAQAIAERLGVNGDDALEAEAYVLMMHHAELGGIIAEHWKLPPLIIQSIKEHHAPSLTATPTVWATYLAAVAAHRITRNDPEAFAHDPNLIAAHEMLGLSNGILKEVEELVLRDLDDVAKTMAIA